MRKTYILDTSAIITDPDVITSLKDNVVVIPLSVIRELDAIKSEPNTERGQKARKAIRVLEELRNKGSLNEGVVTSEDGLVRVHVENPALLAPEQLDNSKTDIKVVAVAHDLGGIVISNDLALCTIADAFGVGAESYRAKNVDFHRDRYTPIELFVDAKTISELVSHHEIYYSFEDDDEPLINQGIILRGYDESSVLGRYIGKGGIQYVNTKQLDARYGAWIRPRNVEQWLALDLLTDPSIQLVNLIGVAGGGKTFVTLAAGCAQVLEGGNTTQHQQKKGKNQKSPNVIVPQYDRIAITKSVISFSNQDLGFLPGTADEKMWPHVANMIDHLDNLLGDEARMFIQSGKIMIEPLAFIRGKSLDDLFLVVDEAQNLSEEDLLTILTRAGNNTKIILTGDPTQCDAPYLNAYNNGLMRVIKAFENQPISGTGVFFESQRQALAKLAAQLLGRGHNFWT